MQVSRPGIIYGVLAFIAGFVLGALRELVLIPVFGDRTGHLIEFVPLVALIIIIAWRIMAEQSGGSPGVALAMGCIGVAVLLALESSVAIFLFGMDVHDYLAGFNIFRGELFPLGLIIMAITPVFFAHRGKTGS